jgi:peptidoglycan/xylan/chitin deacetylase (PgdA/CDA1 family)
MSSRVQKLQWMAQQLAWRIGRRAFVLLYHRINEVGSDPWSLNVTPDHFAEHLEVLRRRYHPLRLQELAGGLARDELPERSVVITFDDGYADNLHYARPVLERYDFPALVFVISGRVGHKREFWWDDLDRLLLQPGQLPESLTLQVNGQPFRWKLAEASEYNQADARRHSRWRAGEEPPTSRHALYHSLWKILKPLPGGKRQTVLEALGRWAGLESSCRSTHRTLTPDEVLALAQGGLVEIGAHTVNHPSLSTLPIESQRDEIQRSKAQLEEILGQPVLSFSYPHGGERDYTSETVALVRDAGYVCACNTFSEAVRRRADQFQLPRVQVRDWDGDEFARWLAI